MSPSFQAVIRNLIFKFITQFNKAENALIQGLVKIGDSELRLTSVIYGGIGTHYSMLILIMVIYSIQFNASFQTQCFYTLSVHSDTYNKNIVITKKDNPTDNYIIILILTKIVKKLDSAIVK